MAKKQLYFGEAERLYVVEHCTLAEIASRLRLAEKTIRNWKDEGDWDVKRRQLVQSKESLHEELYEFCRALLKSIKKDLEEGKKVDPGRMYAFVNIVSKIGIIKNYEADKASEAKDTQPKGGLSEDTLKQIEELLGLG